MRRDADFLRNVLMEIEGGRGYFSTVSKSSAPALGLSEDDGLPDEEAEKLNYHLDQLAQMGLIKYTRVGGGWQVHGFTPSGHDYLDRVR